jgi:23S rRNA pseudouridine2604 synthase
MKDLAESIQVNKYISSSGFCSRREADGYVEQGRVFINDEIALPTSRVYPGDVVTVDGERIKVKASKQSVYIAFNKPRGITSTTDPTDRSNIIYFINHPKRIFPIGRLDKDSEGLILLTNDGDIVNKILRAGNEHEKEYTVTVNKPLTPEFVKRMSSGVPVLGQMTKPCVVRQEGTKRFRIILTQGLNRQIRRMCEYLGYEVVTLKRTRIMNISLGNIQVGKWRNLSNTEVEQITRMVAHSSKTEEASVKRKFKKR